jgi:hypothetical protein
MNDVAALVMVISGRPHLDTTLRQRADSRDHLEVSVIVQKRHIAGYGDLRDQAIE